VLPYTVPDKLVSLDDATSMLQALAVHCSDPAINIELADITTPLSNESSFPEDKIARYVGEKRLITPPLSVPPTSIVFDEMPRAHIAPVHDIAPASDVEQEAPRHEMSTSDDVVTEVPDLNAKVDSTNDIWSVGVIIKDPAASSSFFVVVKSGSAPLDATKSVVVSEVVASIEPSRVRDWKERSTAAP